jgi:hypothetical protein
MRAACRIICSPQHLPHHRARLVAGADQGARAAGNRLWSLLRCCAQRAQCASDLRPVFGHGQIPPSIGDRVVGHHVQDDKLAAGPGASVGCGTGLRLTRGTVAQADERGNRKRAAVELGRGAETLEASKLVFLDETWLSTNMARRCGRHSQRQLDLRRSKLCGRSPASAAPAEPPAVALMAAAAIKAADAHAAAAPKVSGSRPRSLMGIGRPPRSSPAYVTTA